MSEAFYTTLKAKLAEINAPADADAAAEAINRLTVVKQLPTIRLARVKFILVSRGKWDAVLAATSNTVAKAFLAFYNDPRFDVLELEQDFVQSLLEQAASIPGLTQYDVDAVLSDAVVSVPWVSDALRVKSITGLEVNIARSI